MQGVMLSVSHSFCHYGMDLGCWISCLCQLLSVCVVGLFNTSINSGSGLHP
jgi:hypothetical protein